MYLHDIDPIHRPALWQIQSTIIYCTIHFQRGITRAAGQSRFPDSIHSRMESLLTAKSKDDYMAIATMIEGIVNAFPMHCKSITNITQSLRCRPPLFKTGLDIKKSQVLHVD
jgi:hypothetical protein